MTEPAVARTRAELDDAFAAANGRQRAVVMTMGALHQGHGDLIRAARQRVGAHGHITVTIFVNPLQFTVADDLRKYPRTFDADRALCAELGVDAIFAPNEHAMYPTGDPIVRVTPGPLGEKYEGAARPGHFTGVLTVVSKLLHLTQPDIAMFGEKDYQQLCLVRRMVKDLDIRSEIVAVPTTRTPNGLALSSRNQYLSDAELGSALAIPTAISAGQAAAAVGSDADEIRAAALAVLQGCELRTEYVIVTDPEMGPAPHDGEARLIITAYAGTTRLLDNARVGINSGQAGAL